MRWEGVVWIHVTQDRGRVVRSCERGNKPLGSIKGGEFLTYLSDCYLHKEYSASWN
jgi:hypothetical protein